MSQAVGIVIKRVIKAPVEKVFAAWTDPKIMAKWFFPQEDWKAETSNEFKVGGKYEHTMSDGQGNKFQQTGEYKEIIPLKKLVFTWRAFDCKGEVEIVKNTVVTLEFKALKDTTELTLTHDLIPDELREKHEMGWMGCLANLERSIS